jgi:hypothetical protein
VTTLSERLREACQKGREDIEPWQCNPFLFDEAADRIDRMEAALKSIRDRFFPCVGGGIAAGPLYHPQAKIAADALEP